MMDPSDSNSVGGLEVFQVPEESIFDCSVWPNAISGAVNARSGLLSFKSCSWRETFVLGLVGDKDSSTRGRDGSSVRSLTALLPWSLLSESES